METYACTTSTSKTDRMQHAQAAMFPPRISVYFLSSCLGGIGRHLGRVALAVHEGREAVCRTLGAPGGGGGGPLAIAVVLGENTVQNKLAFFPPTMLSVF